MSKETTVSNVRALRRALSEGYDIIHIEGALADRLTKKFEREKKMKGHENVSAAMLAPAVIITIVAIVGGIIAGLTITALMRDYNVEFGYDKYGKQGHWKATKKDSATTGNTEAAGAH